MKNLRREAVGQAIIERLQEIARIGMPPVGYQLPRHELLQRLQLGAAVCSPEIPGAPGCIITGAEGAICAVVSPAGRWVVFELPASLDQASWEKAFTDLAGRATAYLSHPTGTFLAIVDGSAADAVAQASGETR
ncbi:hypothetical protein [Glutamicibacter sp. NPDC087583]|uniref:hypothetical protein n=1 Tax=Glutamicibacter sp. NPDC087583 TaxID=3363995 RepID=UPI00381DB27B